MSRSFRAFGALAAMLVGCLIGVVPACAATGPADGRATAYDSAAYVYDAPGLLSSPDSVAKDARGSPSEPGAASWVSSVSARDRGVAANTAGRAAESAAARTLTAAEQRSVASLQRQVTAHTEKLEAYRANPDAFDNLGYLERAPSPQIRQRIIDGRINHLETEINGFQNQIDKLLGGG